MSIDAFPSVAIIGGGVSGAAVAYHLAERHASATLTVFEPRVTLGAGLAYGTSDPAHRINVPAAKMSLIPEEDRHFVDWIARTSAVADDPEALAEDGELYVRRVVFGRYVHEHLKPWVANGRIGHIREHVTAIEKYGPRWRIVTDSGRSFSADIAVLATTHPPPDVPTVVAKGIKDDPRLFADPSDARVLRSIGRDAGVAIIGTGLTMADVVASLDRRGHRGQITAISRHGLLSRPHALRPYQAFGEFVRNPPLSALELLREIRAAIQKAQSADVPWQAVIDTVRAQATAFWPAMPIPERRKLVRHLRTFWDVHRFRIAPQVDEVIARRRSDGTFTLRAASVRGAEVDQEHIRLHLLPRGASHATHLDADHVVITTGPAHNRVLATAPHLASLASEGWIRPDDLGLGILCNLQGRAIAKNGQAISNLLIAGPLARGTFGELMGLPQVTNYAQVVAGEVLQELERTGDGALLPGPVANAR